MNTSMTYRLELVEQTSEQLTYCFYYEGTELAKCYVPMTETYIPGFRDATRNISDTGFCYIEVFDNFSEPSALVLIAKMEDTLENPKFEIFSYNKTSKILLLKSVLESCNYTRKKSLYVLHD